MMQSAIISAARAMIGTPFRHQGRAPRKALDCAGLVVAVAAELGLKHIDQGGYSRHPSGGMLESALDMQPGLDRVALSDMQPADILLMKFNSDPQHLAIFVGWSDTYQSDGIVHAWLQSRKVCEHVLTDEWRTRIVRVYRFKEPA